VISERKRRKKEEGAEPEALRLKGEGGGEDCYQEVRTETNILEKHHGQGEVKGLIIPTVTSAVAGLTVGAINGNKSPLIELVTVFE